jgi:hypothetical protein
MVRLFGFIYAHLTLTNNGKEKQNEIISHSENHQKQNREGHVHA